MMTETHVFSARSAGWAAVGAFFVIGGLSAAYLARRNGPAVEPDSAPGRTARQGHFGDYAVIGRTVTINRPRSDVYGFWRDFGNLPSFMEDVRDVEELPDGVIRWRLTGLPGRSATMDAQIVQDQPGEEIAWRSLDTSMLAAQGKVSFRDAPGNRGTEVTAIVAYKPPFGALGSVLGKVFGQDPATRTRHDLKRLKMILETGEIATARNRREPDEGEH